jgi:hypothetical protein
MNRQLIIAGLVAFGLMLFVFIVATMAAPVGVPQAQVTEEPEPNNNSCGNAQAIDVGDSVLGQINPITDTDWFSVTTTAEVPYIASAAVAAPTDFKVRLCVYAEGCALMGCSSASASYVEREWDATGSVHFVKIERAVSITGTYANYNLEVVEKYVPPATDMPTNTPIPTETPFPTSPSAAPDQYEEHNSFTDNNAPDRAFVLPATTSLKLSNYLGKATFHTLDPNRDEDWYKLWAKDDKWYQVTTSELSGVDTRVVIYKSNGTSHVTSNDDGGGGYASQVLFKAKYDGYYYIRVHNKVNATGSYNMTIEESDEATPEPTVTPGPGADTKSDSCENNLDFDHACIIAPNNPKKFNFVPPYGGVDNDFFKMWVKPGYNYECSTSDLDAGVDPNMIVFNGPSWDNAVGGNDDIEPGDFNSYFSYYATYEGWLYVLVGYGDRTPSNIYNSNYTLKCNADVPGATATPEPTSGPGATTAPRATAAPPTVTPSAGLSVRPLTTPTPKPETPSEPSLVPIKLLVYYDANGDGQPGAGEGIGGIAAQAYDSATNSSLAQGITDAQGYLEFAARAQGPVRVTVPFFGFSQLVTEETTIRLRVPSSTLP